MRASSSPSSSSSRPTRSAGSSARIRRSSSSASRRGSTPRSSWRSHRAERRRPRTAASWARPGELVDAVFGSDLSYGDAAALQARALEVGFTGTKLERTGCSTFRVVVTGVPADDAVQADFARQAEGVGLPVEYEDAVRYPEVPSGRRSRRRAVGAQSSPPSPPPRRSARSRRSRGAPEPSPKVGVREQRLDRGPEGGRIPRRDEQARDTVLDRVEQAADRASRPPADRTPSPRARRRRSPRGATGRRRRPRARSTRRPARGGTKPTASGTRARSGPSPTTTRGIPSVAATKSRIPFSSDRRPTKRTCGGSSGSPIVAGIVTPLGDDANVARAELARCVRERLRRAEHERARDGRASARPSARAARARRPFPRAGATNGFRVFSAGSAEGSQCAWTRSASRAARRAAREYEARNSGTRSTFHGRRFRFPTMPCPYASPKCRNDAGETTSTSTPAARRCSTASRTNAPATSSGPRGYDVVRTTTFIRAARAPRRGARPRASRTRRSSRRSS